MYLEALRQPTFERGKRETLLLSADPMPLVGLAQTQTHQFVM